MTSVRHLVLPLLFALAAATGVKSAANTFPVRGRLVATRLVGHAAADAPTHTRELSGERLLWRFCGVVSNGEPKRHLAYMAREQATAPDAGTQTVLRRLLDLTAGPGVVVHRCVGIAGHAAARHADAITLPGQSMRYVVPSYLVSSVRRPHHRQSYVLSFAGPETSRLRVSATDPLTGQAAPVRILHRAHRMLTLEVSLASYPRLIVFMESGRGRPQASAKVQGSSTTGSADPFSPTSPWRTALPADAPLDPQSSAIVSNLVAQIQTHYGHAALNTSEYSYPIFTVPANQPTVNMTWNNCQGKSSPGAFVAALQNVPIPAGAFPSQGTDGDMIIWQPSTNTDWEFWKAAKNVASGTWSACWGGKITNVSQNSGVFPRPYGVSASGAAMLASVIRVSEIASGNIDHAIALGVPDPRASLFSWPANRTDGWSSDSSAPAEGERFRLNPALNLNALHLSPGALAIARALQTYGAIVTDTSGAVSIEAEDPRPYQTDGQVDPYSRYFPGPQYSWLQSIPWTQLQAVGWNYGEL